MIGTTVGNYQITAELGRGGMGEVYQAQDVRLGRAVALKFLAERGARDRKAIERFFREARAASALNHPNIVTIYDIGEASSGQFIAMELIQGRTLRSAAQEALSMEELAAIVSQAARALAAAHAAGITHRDVKPENIMLRSDGYVKVLDFGLAHVAPGAGSNATAGETLTEVTDPGTLVGTMRYMSPEQARGETVTHASDVFSLGIVFYELATGRHPFQADSPIGVLHAILSQAPLPASRLKPGIPSPLETLLLRMLEKDPRLRPTAAEVDEALARTPSRAGAARAAPAFPVHTVGRKKQLAELHSFVGAAVAGQGLMVCLAGEPGIGKTTLAERFFSDLAAQGPDISIARGRCSERLAGSGAYLPFLEALDSLLHGPAADWAARALKLVAPTWHVQIAPLPADDSSFARVMAEAKAASQERMKRELVAFLQEVSRARPLVLFFDDLHWADVSTVDLLSYIGSQCGAAPLVIVGTYRPSELLLGKHPFLQVKLELQSRGLCREIPLEFLSREDIETYLALLFPENRFPPELPALIHSKTEGNALFMADMVRYLRDRGVIAEEQGRWTLAQAVPEIERELPESVRSMIQRKIDQLAEADRRLLVAASVQGHTFDSAIAARVLGLDPAEVEERLEALDRLHGFVRVLGEREFPDATLSQRYCFVHVLYQNALYATLTATRRTALSAAVAEALLACWGERSSEAAAELALLFEAARDFGRAAGYFAVAARNAAALRASQEAIGLLRRSLASAEKLRGEARHAGVIRAASELARVYENLTLWTEAVEAHRLAEKAAAEAGDAAAEVQAVCGKANGLLMAKKMDECREQIRRGFELAGRLESKEALAAVEMAQYCERLSAGDFQVALDCYEHAAPVLREKGLSPASLLGLNFRGALHGWRLEHQEAEHVLDWSMEKAREVGALARILQSSFLHAITIGHQGRLGQALDMLHETRRLAELNGERFVLSRVPNTLGWLHRELLDLEGALDFDLEGARLAQQTGDAEAEINSCINAGQVYLLLGEPARAFESLERAEDLLSRFNWFRWVFNIRLQAELASCWIARGDLKRAASHAAASLEISQRALSRKHMALAHKLLGDIAALEERVGDARQQYEAALRVFETHACPPAEWRVRKAWADLARRVGDSSLAEEQAGRARAVIASLADSLRDEKLRRNLLLSPAVREL